jgi:hypothetical protein
VTERLNALGAAFNRELLRRVRRSILVAAGAGLVAAFAFIPWRLPIGVSDRVLISFGAFLAAFAGILALALLRQLGGTFGDALAVVAWGRRHAEGRWQQLGAGRIPGNPREAVAWLAAHPDDDSLLPQRLTAQLATGDLDGARETLRGYPTATAADRYELVGDAWYLNFLAGGSPPLDAVADAAAAVEQDPPWAAVYLATSQAHVAAVSNGDWVSPLAQLRGQLGARADGLVGLRYVLPMWAAGVAGSLAAVGIVLFILRVTGLWT